MRFAQGKMFLYLKNKIMRFLSQWNYLFLRNEYTSIYKFLYLFFRSKSVYSNEKIPTAKDIPTRFNQNITRAKIFPARLGVYMYSYTYTIKKKKKTNK